MIGIGLIEPAKDLIELGIGLRIHVSCHCIHNHIHLRLGYVNGLGIGLIELGIGLRIKNAGAPYWPVYPALFF